MNIYCHVDSVGKVMKEYLYATSVGIMSGNDLDGGAITFPVHLTQRTTQLPAPVLIDASYGVLPLTTLFPSRKGVEYAVTRCVRVFLSLSGSSCEHISGCEVLQNVLVALFGTPIMFSQ